MAETNTTRIDVLVIDDDIDMLNWFKMLNNVASPIHFYTLQNEINASQAMLNIKPKIIFLDISLNTLDGPLVASILNGNNFDSKYIISMSADKKYKKSINEENFLLKPLTKDMVMNKIQEVLKAK